jgi:hypothetical protein
MVGMCTCAVYFSTFNVLPTWQHLAKPDKTLVRYEEWSSRWQ